jgi:hypothetical protein
VRLSNLYGVSTCSLILYFLKTHYSWLLGCSLIATYRSARSKPQKDINRDLQKNKGIQIRRLPGWTYSEKKKQIEGRGIKSCFYVVIISIHRPQQWEELFGTSFSLFLYKR